METAAIVSRVTGCEWCGHPHPPSELCSERPLARGVTRRSFLALFGAGIAGLALGPQLPLTATAPIDLKIMQLDRFGQLTERVWIERVWPGEPLGLALRPAGQRVIGVTHWVKVPIVSDVNE
jgi:hypothetical protein